LIITRGWTVPQRNDDGQMPPVKTLRKRLSGVYRADGFSGPTRRYVLIVAMLVGLASLPTLAAITAGSNELDDGSTGALDEPFLPPVSPGPVPAITPPAVAGGEVQGQAHKQKSKPDHSRYARIVPPSKDDPRRSRPGRSRVAPREEAATRRPARPSRPVRPDQPACHERANCGTRPSHHHRPDRSRHKQWWHHKQRSQWSRHQQCESVRNRSERRSEPTRRATVAEHPQNVRPARTAERTHNSRRLQAESRPDDARSANRSYHGSHRAERRHDSGNSRAHHRNSGADRHDVVHTGRR
jgi:hypothetical protein